MNLKTYNLSEEGLTFLASSEMAPEWFTDDQVRWIDVMASESDEMERLLEPLDLDEEIRVAGAAKEARPEVIAFEELLFVRQSFLGCDGKVHTLRLLCGPTAILSARTVPVVEIDQLGSALAKGVRKVRPTVAAMLIELLEAVIREGGVASRQLRDQINDSSDSLETHSDKIDSANLLALKRRSSEMACLIEDQLICLRTLSIARSASLGLSEVREELRTMIDILEHVRPIVLRLEEQARELRQAYAGMLQEASNRRLNVLAIMSAIYLPSTLIAGIYGMNFENIPIMDVSGGYWIVLSLMIALVAGQLVFFWFRGWFK